MAGSPDPSQAQASNFLPIEKFYNKDADDTKTHNSSLATSEKAIDEAPNALEESPSFAHLPKTQSNALNVLGGLKLNKGKRTMEKYSSAFTGGKGDNKAHSLSINATS